MRDSRVFRIKATRVVKKLFEDMSERVVGGSRAVTFMRHNQIQLLRYPVHLRIINDIGLTTVTEK